ncbi:putative membrane domain protein, partial [Yersinia pestis PY-66]
MDTYSLSLSAHTLITINGIINIENIFRIETLQKDFHDKIRLLDTQGDIIFSIGSSDL